MFRDLRERVTPTRRLLAWVLLALVSTATVGDALDGRSTPVVPVAASLLALGWAAGLVALLVDAFRGETPEVVLRTPDDVLAALHLSAALGMTRQQGARGVIARIKREIHGQLAQS